MAAIRRRTPDHPTPGKFPVLSYEYDEAGRVHKIKCSGNCRAICETTEELVARRFVTSHMGEHARLRIVTPAEAIEDQ